MDGTDVSDSAVDDDGAILVERDTQRLEAEPRRIGVAAGGGKDEIGVEVGTVDELHGQTSRRLVDALHLHAGPHIDAAPPESVGELVPDLAIKATQDLLTAIKHGGCDAETIENGRKFEGDVAASHHHRLFGQGWQVEHVGRGDRMLHAGDLRQHRTVASGDQDAAGGNRPPLGHKAKFVGTGDDGAVADDLHARPLEVAGINAFETGDLPLLGRLQSPPVEGPIADLSSRTRRHR